MRGKKSLFDDSIKIEKSPRLTQGRNKELLSKRNNALIARYYVYTTMTKMRYDSIISILVEEFFLSGYTIAKVLSENYGLLKEIKLKSPTIQSLKKTLPHFNWCLNEIQQ